MDKEHVQELAALYALGVLDDSGTREVERLLADSDLLRKEISSFEDVASLLAQSVPAPLEPPAGLKEKLFQKINQKPVTALAETKGSPEINGLTFMREAASGGWQKLPVPGAEVKLLSMDESRGVAVVLGKLAPGARYPSHRHFGPEDVYMISGDLHIGEEVLRAGDFHHAAAGSVHEVNYSENGCTILVVLTTQDLMAQLHAV